MAFAAAKGQADTRAAWRGNGRSAQSSEVRATKAASREEREGAVCAAERALATATEVQEAEARQEAERQTPGLRMPPALKASGGASGLAAFAAYSKGSLAPWWLFQGVCDEWGFDVFVTELRLITVSENATYAVMVNEKPFGVLRVSQPGYVGGPIAVASEIAWVNALHDVEGVSVVEAIPTASGFPVATISDEAGTEWACVCTNFVEGVVLENLPDPSAFYRTIGRWAALFHQHARTWRKPGGFHRFAWDVPDMVGARPRWGRWEDVDLATGERALLERAQDEALAVLAQVPKTNSTWGLIHADLRPSNVIAGADGTLTVIDFDDCGYSYFLYDYAAALSFVEHEPYAPAMAREWMAGYQEVAPLSEKDRACASALSMIRRLQTLGWTTNHYADALPDGLFDAQAPGTVHCAECYLKNHTWLLDA